MGERWTKHQTLACATSSLTRKTIPYLKPTHINILHVDQTYAEEHNKLSEENMVGSLYDPKYSEYGGIY